MVTSDAPANPWLSWSYVQDNAPEILRYLGQHTSLSAQAVVIALLVAVPLAALAHTWPRLSGLVLGTTGVLYTIPSLALFAVVYPFLRDRRTTVLVGLVLYALLLVVRNTLVGLRGVDPDVRDAARGLGYGRWRLLLTVELPNALPSVITGVRLASVSTVALMTVGVVIGYGGLGQLMFRGFASGYRAQIMTATILCLLLGLAFDLVVSLVGRLVTPWARTKAAR
ncbi:ABC transporter permease [Sanguibacter antarcticus]|uniref:Osmoprotectant transport system permease protein n=1 Tax=Sanguibacter antarcticus TaxID=372484 RepID=A0A2A9E7X1_9MICO|nr:ABC transporter permease [Sanguibacter antarcticus]PFG34661.1 osmoprotectant transport system permease protein [Sanguibacter antarcticus]